MKYGYARVSTAKQDLQTQINALEAENCQVIYQDKLSGRDSKRPQFLKLLSKLKAGDMLVVTKLDRLARSTQEALKIIKDLFDREVTVHILNLGRIENTPTGKLIYTVFSAFADFERDLIVERTQEGKALARQNGTLKDGRPPKYKKAQLDHALALKKEHTYTEITAMTGISKSTLIRYQKKVERVDENTRH
ncbi:recombinase family protein [Aerococcus urinaeequi]|uniref:recombinase family protein n=1 Tax=Aerococcus urinaeequi TaxID=51665 RepID=UPI003EC60716